jgi:hypothetical protein
MPDLLSKNTRPPLQELQDYHREYAPRRFPSAKTKRAQQNIAKKIRMPLIRVGHTTLIDPVAGDNRLRELALYQTQPEQQQQRRRRGRPRTVNVITPAIDDDVLLANAEFPPEPERRGPGRPRTGGT